MEDFTPYSDREEHKYVNKMTTLIARGRLVIKTATQVVDDLQAETEEHVKYFLKRRREEDKET